MIPTSQIFEVALRSWLLESPAISSVVGDRVIAVEASERSTYPIAIYTVVSSGHEYSHGGDSNMITARVQFDLWASQHLDVLSLAQAFADRLSGYRGMMGAFLVDSVFVEGNEGDHPYNDELKIYGRHLDALITYHRPLAAGE